MAVPPGPSSPFGVRIGTLVVSLALVLAASPGCSLKRMALGSVANALSGTGTTFASDEDPELIRAAVPFSLKTMESLLEELPNHAGLLLATCSGFTQYAYAFVETDAAGLEQTDFERSRTEKERARKLYVRARDYCLRHLELNHPGIGRQLSAAPDTAMAAFKRAEVPALYWTGAAWGSAISIGLDHPELVADLPAVRAMMRRALALDEAYERGAVHAAMISLESVPEAMGGSPARAREHFKRAVELSKGQSAGPFVTLAAGLAVAEQNRAEFVSLLEQALAIDPDTDPSQRLANLVVQRRARQLLAQVDDLFLSEGDSSPSPAPAVSLISPRVIDPSLFGRIGSRPSLRGEYR